MDLSLFGQSQDAERRRPAAHPVLAPGSPTPRARGPTRRSTQLNTLLWLPQSGASEDGHFLSLRRTQTLHSPGLEKSLNLRGFLSAMGSFVHYFSPTRKSEEPKRVITHVPLFPGCRVTIVLLNAIDTCRGSSSLRGLSSSDHQVSHTPNCGPACCGTHGPRGRCRGSAQRT